MVQPMGPAGSGIDYGRYVAAPGQRVVVVDEQGREVPFATDQAQVGTVASVPTGYQPKGAISCLIDGFFDGAKNMVKSIISTPKGFLIAASVATLCIISGGTLVMPLALLGGAIGGYKILTNGSKAAACYADGNIQGAEQAMSGVGEGLFEVTAAVIGAKTAPKVIKNVQTGETFQVPNVLSNAKAAAEAEAAAAGTSGAMRIRGHQVYLAAKEQGKILLGRTKLQGDAGTELSLFQLGKANVKGFWNSSPVALGARAKAIEVKEGLQGRLSKAKPNAPAPASPNPAAPVPAPPPAASAGPRITPATVEQAITKEMSALEANKTAGTISAADDAILSKYNADPAVYKADAVKHAETLQSGYDAAVAKRNAGATLDSAEAKAITDFEAYQTSSPQYFEAPAPAAPVPTAPATPATPRFSSTKATTVIDAEMKALQARAKANDPTLSPADALDVIEYDINPTAYVKKKVANIQAQEVHYDALMQESAKRALTTNEAKFVTNFEAVRASTPQYFEIPAPAAPSVPTPAPAPAPAPVATTPAAPAGTPKVTADVARQRFIEATQQGYDALKARVDAGQRLNPLEAQWMEFYSRQLGITTGNKYAVFANPFNLNLVKTPVNMVRAYPGAAVTTGLVEEQSRLGLSHLRVPA